MPKMSLKSVTSEVKKTFKNPLRIFNIFDSQKRIGWFRSYQPENQPRDWENRENFRFKKYDTYEEYVQHQKSKLDRILEEGEKHWFNQNNYDLTYRTHLRDRLKPYLTNRGLNVLCLAARLGTEVKAFIDLGCFAIGIDLNPGLENHYVVVGDFHNIQYADKSLDIVFTNSFDHALYPEKILQEISRVLKPNGRFMTDVASIYSNQGTYEAFSWSSIEDLVSLIEKFNLKIIHQEEISYPFKGGNFLIFEKIVN